MKPPYRIDIPPYGSAEIVCKLKAFRPEAFELSQTIFVDDGGVRPVVLTVTGIGVPAGEDDTDENERP